MNFNGIISAMVTPMTKDQEVNEAVSRQLTDHLIRSGIHGIFILGTNGEFHVLTPEEKVTLARCVVDEVKGRVPVIVGTGANSTKETIEMSLKMEEEGVDALSVITPYFIAPTQKEIVQHYERIAVSTILPILIYNIPSRTGVDLEEETVAELAKIPNIAGIKDSSGRFENIKQYIKVTQKEDFSVLAGTDSLILSTLQAGGTGAIASTSNMLPELVVSIYNSWKEGNEEEARRAQDNLQPLRDTFGYGTLPSVLKKAVELYGIPVGPPRAPVSELNGEALEKVKEMVAYYKGVSAEGVFRG